jgi:hypothetical protein
MAHAGREFVEREFSRRVWATRYLATLTELADRTWAARANADGRREIPQRTMSHL